LKLNGKQKLLFVAGDVNILGGSFHTLNKNTEALLFASQETGLHVNVEITKYMVMSPNKGTT
jgi:hypothetical protein